LKEKANRDKSLLDFDAKIKEAGKKMNKAGKALDKFWEKLGQDVQIEWDDDLYLSTIIGADGAVDKEGTE
jgi:hypothetical protein